MRMSAYDQGTGVASERRRRHRELVNFGVPQREIDRSASGLLVYIKWELTLIDR